MSDYFTPAELREKANGKSFLFGCYSMRPDYTPVICPYYRGAGSDGEHYCSFSHDGCGGFQAKRITDLGRCPLMEAAKEQRQSLNHPDRGIMDYDEHHPLSDLIRSGVIEDPSQVETGSTL